ncbi:conserved hypothethical protein (plasmid) [Ralstonia solanacearum CMR15]|nr:conserved hypothethical protein [Ralstonia solanacearum CMR15]
MSASDYDLQLADLHSASIGKLQQAEVFDQAAFQALYDYLRLKADAIGQEHVISKQVVHCLLAAQKAILGMGEHVLVQGKRDAAMAGDFYALLDLIALGERLGDRVPGVPRIV